MAQDTVAGVPYVQVVLPLPVCAVLVGAIETTLMQNAKATAQERLEPAMIEVLAQTREFFEDVHDNPNAFPVTGKMAANIKSRSRVHRRLRKAHL